MRGRILAFWAVALSILGVGLYGFLQGVPERDIVSAVRTGDLAEVKRLLERDPALANAKVYPQAYERADQRRDYYARTGEDPWRGRLVIHDAVDTTVEKLPVLEALVAAGARLDARLAGRTLLHDAASQGNAPVAAWLIDRGADVNAANDCKDRCAESGWRPLHNAQRFRPAELVALLASRGASLDATAADGRTALHVAAATGSLEGAFALCRHGADPTRKDASGSTPHALSLKPVPPGDVVRVAPDDPAELPAWLAPGAGCEEVSATARRDGKPVSEDDSRIVYAKHGCALGIAKLCAKR
ncbi:MAG: ankyrin repeat domain-containing protein [Burkholderiales bacterium]|nr:ankyrin repeat domain-containing protein [Burkholderiales bacterium]